ncbi:hypothetical protein [Cumulibacter soli]|nr:hypothetical protein [Cumulibacter soli]
MSLAAVSPAAEHLLWLPDLVCSAYRQKITRNDAALYNEIAALTRVVRIP